MGATKSYEFSDKEDKLAKVAKALGHPARIAILNLLPKRQTCVYGIVDELLLFQSSFIASKRIERYRINNLRN